MEIYTSPDTRVFLQKLIARLLSKLLTGGRSSKFWELKMWLFSHSFYCPGLAPCYFFIFAGMKSHLQWLRFQDFPEIQEQSLTCSTPIPKSVPVVLAAVDKTQDLLQKLAKGQRLSLGNFWYAFISQCLEPMGWLLVAGAQRCVSRHTKCRLSPLFSRNI